MKTKLIESLMITILLSITFMAVPLRAHTEDNPFTTDLLAGQTIEVGTVSIWNDETQLHVKYSTIDGWVITETHLAVAESLDDIPQTRSGNPIPGRFSQKMEHDPALTEHEYVVELDDWEPGDQLYIAAQAVVQKPIEEYPYYWEETAWGDGTQFPGENWAMYIIYTLQGVSPTPTPSPTD